MTVTAINEFSAVAMPLLWKASWQGGVALLLLILISRALSQVPAYVKCWLWRLAFLKLLIAGLWIVPVELRWLPPAESVASQASSWASSPIAAETPVSFDTATVPLTHSGIQSAARPQAMPQLTRSSLLLIAWILGVAMLLVNLFRHWIQARRTLLSLEPATDERAIASLAENCRLLHLRRQPELRIAPESGGPYLIGIFRPVIVLPQVILDSCSAEELSALMIHELAHIKRRDLLWNWLPALAEVVFFFHPLVWLARREWRLVQEIATDELAVSASRVDVEHYARSLVALVAKCRTTTAHPHLAVTLSEAYTKLSRRMIAMQTFKASTPSRRIAMALAVLVVAILGIVPWKLTPGEAQAAAIPTPVAEAEPATADAPQESDTTPSRTIVIRVVDSKGKPIEGAEVFRNHVYEPEGIERVKIIDGLAYELKDQPKKIENKHYRTSADGKAVIALSGTSVDLRLWARKDNFVPLHAMWAKQFQSDGDQIPKEFTFQFQPGTSIGGFVRNEKGEPIEGVRVEVQDMTAMTPIRSNPRPPGIRPVRDCWLAEEEDACITDAQGRWTLNNVPPDESLVFDETLRKLSDMSVIPMKLTLRLNHPDYESDSHWGGLQRNQDVYLDSLRDGTATIVMKRKSRQEPKSD